MTNNYATGLVYHKWYLMLYEYPTCHLYLSFMGYTKSFVSSISIYLCHSHNIHIQAISAIHTIHIAIYTNPIKKYPPSRKSLKHFVLDKDFPLQWCSHYQPWLIDHQPLSTMINPLSHLQKIHMCKISYMFSHGF